MSSKDLVVRFKQLGCGMAYGAPGAPPVARLLMGGRPLSDFLPSLAPRKKAPKRG